MCCSACLIKPLSSSSFVFGPLDLFTVAAGGAAGGPFVGMLDIRAVNERAASDPIGLRGTSLWRRLFLEEPGKS